MRARVVVAALCAAALCAGCTVVKHPPPPDAAGTPAYAPSVPLSVAACEPAGWCVAAGTDPSGTASAAALEVSHGGRERWVPGAMPALAATTLLTASCWASGCILGGAGPRGAAMVLVDPAHRDASVLDSPAGASVDALACTGPGRCLALVGTATSVLADSTTSSGASWTDTGTLPLALGAADALACRNPADCVAVGTGSHGAVAATTTDGGARWALSALPARLQVVTSAGCTPRGFCVAAGRRLDGAPVLLESRDGGRSWQLRASAIGAPGPVACTASSCLVGGGSAAGQLAVLSATGGWRGLSLAYVPLPFVALGCASPVRCAGIAPSSTVSIALG